MKNCTICGDPIPDLRLELSPNTVTCSKKCSLANTRRIKAASMARRRERERATREDPKP